MQLEDLERNNVFIQRIDYGGLGINYVDQSKPEIEKLVEIIKKEIPEKYQIILEPGRSIVGRSGSIAKVEYIKRNCKKFLSS